MPPLSGIDAISSAAALPAPTLRPAGDDTSFAQSITGAVDELRALQSTSNELAVAAVTGDLDDIHSAMIASTRASVTLELVAAVRNKGVEAFNDIMRMQA
ncbi:MULTISPECIES: flagellar hook-basal body complex protein FliE [Microbacterium]|uniref:flagellar hook-basal body complex protein FliE n=1 Tax=Microbacterium TaxID=33882 RepID=UPI00214B0E78|nr:MULTISPECIES: flagellar hook-basal body complex protein FliE [unclassified Microbacterium]MCR2813977.1 flagellar hook-basal body complex protein FliE [Microbacterium sp. zg.Y1084]MDL5487168.1 flagellar hook-basal body complex protein FliE [Microbacterium sp. zg-Y1211]